MQRSNRRLRQLALAAWALAAPLPLFAVGTVYAPLPGKDLVNGVDWEPRLVIANRGKVDRTFFHTLLPLDKDGTQRGAVAVATPVPAGDTFVLELPNAPAGLLELVGAPQFIYTAQLVRAGETDPLAVTLPTITSDNLFPAHDRLFLQGWLRVGSKVTDLSLINLGHQSAQCQVRSFRANGTEVAAAATVTLFPLSHRIYKDVLQILGAPVLSDVRADVSCDQRFYAFSLVRDITTGELSVITPSATGDKGLPDVGGGPAPGPCPPAAFKCFSKPGVFFAPTKIGTHREIFALPEGAYSKVHFRVEVYLKDWKKPSDGLHSFFWLAVDGRHFRLLGMAYAKGPSDNTMLIRHGDKIEAGLKPKFKPHFVGVPGTTYVVDYTYAPVEKSLVLVISEKGGGEVLRVTDKPNVNRIHVESNEFGLAADFSTEGDHPNEPSTIGWRYSNLSLEVYP